MYIFNENTKKLLRLKNQQGVVIRDVEKDSPGHEAGLKVIDVILKVQRPAVLAELKKLRINNVTERSLLDRLTEIWYRHSLHEISPSDIGEDEIETEQQLLGSIISDYVRTGISTMLNTGTIIGLGANVFGRGFQPKNIPPFQWGIDDKTELDKFIQTLEIIKKRRNKSLSQSEKSLISKLYSEFS